MMGRNGKREWISGDILDYIYNHSDGATDSINDRLREILGIPEPVKEAKPKKIRTTRIYRFDGLKVGETKLFDKNEYDMAYLKSKIRRHCDTTGQKYEYIPTFWGMQVKRVL